MNGWQEFKLSDFVELGKEQFKPNPNADYNYIGLEHIEQEKLRLNSIGHSSEIASNKFHFKEGDILFGKLRPYFRKVVKAKFDGVCSTDIWVMRAKHDFSQDFLFYFVANWDFVNIANAGEGGSRMPRADWSFLKDSEWSIPPLPEQKAIAAVFSSLDDKIDLLHRQNETLEAMAETLFRQWFVEEAREDWEIGPLKEYVDIAIGRTPLRKEHQWFSENPTDVKWISIKDLGNDGAYIFKTAEYLTQDAVDQFNIPVIPENTVVLSFKMTVGRVAITTEAMLSNEAIAHFKFNQNTQFTVEYLYLFLKNFKYDSLGSTSSIVTAINSTLIKDIEIRIPDSSSVQEFDEVARDLFKKIRRNQLQIQTLEKLRDTLLPKLMSGEAKVSF